MATLEELQRRAQQLRRRGNALAGDQRAADAVRRTFNPRVNLSSFASPGDLPPSTGQPSVTNQQLDSAFAPTSGQRPSATLEPIPFPNVGLGPGVGVTGPQTGARATQSSGQTQTGQTSTRQPAAVPRRQLSPQATGTDNSALARMQRAIAIRQGTGGVQGSRADAESSVNDDIAENLRLNLLEQQRLQSSLRSARTPVEANQIRANLRATQAAIDSGLTGVGGIRQGEVTRRGQLTEAETTLEARTRAEAGAFDRAGLQIDVAETQGRFGLSQRELANEGAVAAATALNPREQFGLNLLQKRQENVENFGTRQERARFTNSAINSTFGAAPLGDPTAGPENVTVTVPGGEDGFGTEIQTSPQKARQIGTYLTALALPELAGIPPEARKQDIADIVSGRKTPQQVVDERKAEAEANRLRVGPQPENAFRDVSFGLGPS